jgi:O-antigen ligase
MSLASPVPSGQRVQQVFLAVAGVMIFCIPILMALGDFASWVPKLNQILVLLLLVVCGVCYISFRPKLIPEIWLFVAFGAWAGLSGIIVADDRSAFFAMFMRIARACGLAVAIAGIAQLRRSATVNFAAVLLVALGLAAYSWQAGILQTGLEVETNDLETPWNANTFGVVMLSGVFALAYLWGIKRLSFLRALVPFLALALMLALLSSASRKSFISLLLFGLLWLWFCYLRQRSRNISTLLVLGCLFAVGYFVTGYVLQNSRLGLRLENTGADGGDQARLSMYEALPVLLKKNLLAGVGLGNFGTHANSITGSYAYSHSDYVEVLTTTGLVGALLYFPIYIVWWRRLVRISQATGDPEVRYHAQVFQAILLTMLFLGLGIPHFMQTEQWYWMAALIGCTYAWETAVIKPGGRIARFPTWRKTGPKLARLYRPRRFPRVLGLSRQNSRSH